MQMENKEENIIHQNPPTPKAAARRVEIIPAILKNSFKDIQDCIEQVSGSTKYIQIDICDGVFSNRRTWMPDEKFIISINETGMPHWQDTEYECDLMVADYVKYIELSKEMGASRIVCHLNNISDIEIASTLVRKYDIAFGLATDNKNVLEQAIKGGLVDYVQIMGIEYVGRQGEPFRMGTIDDIVFVKSLDQNMIIQIDGSMNNETIPLCKNAGATRFVVGSFIFKSNSPTETIRNLKRL
jgi:ribulose-phosphate 3-epimerase